MAKNKSKVQKAEKVGSSDFTYQDDLGAEVHPSDYGHHEAMFYGGNVPAKHQLSEVVMGPAAFGSPDPRTLGHTMTPVVDAPSAPDLSEDYAGGKAVAGVDENLDEGNKKSTKASDKGWKKSDTKDDLLKEANDRGLDVSDEDTKDDIISALEDSDEENEGTEETSDDEENQ